MVQYTYLIPFCWNTANDTTNVLINTLGLPPRELHYQIVVYLPKINRMLLGS